jgi:CheY-like chemotaxis protein
MGAWPGVSDSHNVSLEVLSTTVYKDCIFLLTSPRNLGRIGAYEKGGSPVEKSPGGAGPARPNDWSRRDSSVQRMARARPSCFTVEAPSPRILVADDDDLLRRFLLTGLRAAGFDVVAAVDGSEALGLFRDRGPFDVLLLDEEMPKLSGRAVLRHLRSEGETLPAVLFSGSLTLTDAEQEALGVRAVVRKPCGLAELVEALCQALAARAFAYQAAAHCA